MTYLILTAVALSIGCFVHAAKLLRRGQNQAFVARYWIVWPILMSFGIGCYLRLYPALTPPPWPMTFICFGGALIGGWYLSSVKHHGLEEQRADVGRDKGS